MESNLNIKTIKVSDKGQIAIPQIIREKAGINRGDELVIVQIGGKILLEKSQKMSNQMKEDFKDIISFSEQSLKDVWDNKEDEIWSTYLKK